VDHGAVVLHIEEKKSSKERFQLTLFLHVPGLIMYYSSIPVITKEM